MKLQNLVSTALLLFVAAAVVMLVGREIRQPPTETTPAVTDQLPAHALVVYYFHGETRCPTCRDIERYSHEAVQSAFAEDLAQDKVNWRVVNYEQPENSHFAADYEIVAPTVVLVRMADGKVVDWRNLGRVWELVGDQEVFTEYLQNEIRSMLGS